MKKWLYLISLFGVLILSFQNCSDVSIAPSEPIELSSSMKLTASACANARLLPTEKTKFVFVVDFSVSNIGAFYRKGSSTFFNPDLATDPEGDRFEVIKNFIETCGATGGAEFAVIGFADSAGQIVREGTSDTWKCDQGFSGPEQALNTISSLKQRQIDETPSYLQWSEANNKPLEPTFKRGLLGNTNYEDALNCLKTTVVEDLVQEINDAKNYHIFFVSDGIPLAKRPHDCEGSTTTSLTPDQKMQCWRQKIEEIASFTVQAALAQSKRMRIHSLYYTKGLDNSTEIASYLNLLSSIGSTSQAINLGNISESMAGGVNPFCSLMDSKNAVAFHPDLIQAVNMTTKNRRGTLERDTDGDGLSDKEEIELNYNPQKYDSMVTGIRDSVCHQSQCQSKVISGCSLSQKNGFSLNSCELQLLGLAENDGVSDAGIDTDRDGMPDVIEIYKGTNPTSSIDMSEDPDRDGESTRSEILKGRDPFTRDPLGTEQAQYEIFYNNKISSDCGTGSWDMSIDFIPGTAGENSLLFFYRSVPQNSSTQRLEFYQHTLRVNYVQGESKIKAMIPETDFVGETLFEKAGEVSP